MPTNSKLSPAFGEDGGNSKTFGSEEDLLQNLKVYKIKYLVQVPFSDADQVFNDLIDKVEQKYPRLLKEVYACKDRRFVIFECSRPN